MSWDVHAIPYCSLNFDGSAGLYSCFRCRIVSVRSARSISSDTEDEDGGLLKQHSGLAGTRRPGAEQLPKSGSYSQVLRRIVLPPTIRCRCDENEGGSRPHLPICPVANIFRGRVSRCPMRIRTAPRRRAVTKVTSSRVPARVPGLSGVAAQRQARPHWTACPGI